MEVAKITQYQFENVLNPEGANSIAQTIKGYASGNGLITKIQGRDYAQVDAWQYAGSLLGLFPKVVRVEDLSKEGEIKYLAEVHIISATGDDKATGVAICSNLERTKKQSETNISQKLRFCEVTSTCRGCVYMCSCVRLFAYACACEANGSGRSTCGKFPTERKPCS